MKKQTANGNLRRKRLLPSFGVRMVAGLTELRDSLRAGERLEDRFTVRTVALDLKPRSYTANAIRRLRTSLGASQAVFAQIIGVNASTVQSWEQGVREPSAMACRFLEEIERHRTEWVDRLRGAALTG